MRDNSYQERVLAHPVYRWVPGLLFIAIIWAGVRSCNEHTAIRDTRAAQRAEELNAVHLSAYSNYGALRGLLGPADSATILGSGTSRTINGLRASWDIGVEATFYTGAEDVADRRLPSGGRLDDTDILIAITIQPPFKGDVETWKLGTPCKDMNNSTSLTVTCEERNGVASYISVRNPAYEAKPVK